MGHFVISQNTWIHRIVRVAIKPLANTPVTPNQLTTLRLAVGVAAALAFAIGSAFWMQMGAGLFVASMALDRADGELARMTGKTSLWGHKYDLISDSASNALAFVGLGVGLSSGELGLKALPLGMLAGAAVTSVLWLVMRIEEMEGAYSAELKSFYGFDADDAMLLVPIAIWLHLAEPLLIAAAVGAPLFAVIFFLVFRHKLAAGG